MQGNSVKKRMILDKINNDRKSVKGGPNFLVNKLNFFH